jgi:hypothetical protein
MNKIDVFFRLKGSHNMESFIVGVSCVIVLSALCIISKEDSSYEVLVLHGHSVSDLEFLQRLSLEKKRAAVAAVAAGSSSQGAPSPSSEEEEEEEAPLPWAGRLRQRPVYRSS